ncbi:MAG TPA: hypothetical protein VME17_13695 [Bryobacteraceae bacterium]|nr:hypothetical protein [Bryobacteraceae bacterium]
MRTTILLVAVALVSVPAWADKVVPTGGPGTDSPSICDAITGNLVSNCGFETGDFTSWILSGNTTDIGVSSFSQAGYGPNSGEYYAFLGAVGSDDILSQAIATIAGQSYVFTFYLASDGGTPNDFTAMFGGDTVFSETDIPQSGYVEWQYDVAASSSSTVIAFDSRDDPGFLSLDDISVVAGGTTATPEPRFYGMALGLLGLAGIVIGKRRKRDVTV